MKIVAFALMLVAGLAQAQYKCTARSGAVTYQQAACPSTQTQRDLNRRAVPQAVASPTVAAASAVPAPHKVVEPATHAVLERDRRSKEFDQAAARIEADFERLKMVRADLETVHALASR